jgi:23S rRNA G2069 N7-methylase RlmK/C1962 C5-methylase RlmI
LTFLPLYSYRGGVEALSPEKTAAQAEMFRNRLRKRWRHLKKWAARTGTEVFRLYDRDIPEIPLALDRYGDAATMALYERPYEKDEAEEEQWLAAMAGAAAEALELPPGRLFLRERKRQRQKTQYGRLGEEGFTLDLREGGLVFRVNLSDYLDTGLFPDRRKMRSLVRGEAAGKRVLNLFCYTASFSVYAAAGGASAVDSVDLSRTYLDWAAVNFGLNGISARLQESRDFFADRGSRGKGVPCRLIRAEALSFLDQAARSGLRWDTIILDPPSFSNSKRMTGTLDIRRDHRDLITRCLGLLEKGGCLWFSVNARRFSLDSGEFLGEFPGLRIRQLEKEIVDEDFLGKKLPRCYTFRR